MTNETPETGSAAEHADGSSGGQLAGADGVGVTAPRVLGVLLVVVGTPLVWYPSLLGPLLPGDFVLRNLAQQGIDWAFCLALIGIVVFWERDSLASMGFRKLTKENLAAGLGLGGFFMVALVLWTLAAGALSSGDPSFGAGTIAGAVGGSAGGPPTGFFYWYGPIALVTAAFCEEVIYRGYAMERLLRMFKTPWPAIVLPHAAFALMHIKDGWDKVAMVGVIGLLFVWFYYRYRDLTMTIVAHFMVDALALVGGLLGVGGD